MRLRSRLALLLVAVYATVALLDSRLDWLIGTSIALLSVMLALAWLWLRHTSASLTINENADGAVRRDFERFFNRLVPQGQGGYEHDYEGPDDLPAHFKASLLGCQVNLPVGEGQMVLGTWQGIYLGEHRDRGGARQVVATLHGMAS